MSDYNDNPGFQFKPADPGAFTVMGAGATPNIPHAEPAVFQVGGEPARREVERLGRVVDGIAARLGLEPNPENITLALVDSKEQQYPLIDVLAAIVDRIERIDAELRQTEPPPPRAEMVTVPEAE